MAVDVQATLLDGNRIIQISFEWVRLKNVHRCEIFFGDAGIPLSLSFVSEKDSSQLARFSDVVNATDSVSIPSLLQDNSYQRQSIRTFKNSREIYLVQMARSNVANCGSVDAFCLSANWRWIPSWISLIASSREECDTWSEDTNSVIWFKSAKSSSMCSKSLVVRLELSSLSGWMDFVNS